jgi:N-methylhydantoinase B
MTPGGGGIGDPREREPAWVDRDLEDGLVSQDAAATAYGRQIRKNAL